MSQSVLVLLTATALMALPLAAQGPGAGQGSPPAPLPDHWLTLDSLAAAVGLTAEQRVRVGEPYTALNAVMKDAAEKRQALRRRMMSQMGGSAPAEMTPAERERMRALGDSARGELQALQAEADQWHLAIRGLLTPEQQAKFDGLPKPVVFRQGMRRSGPGS